MTSDGASKDEVASLLEASDNRRANLKGPTRSGTAALSDATGGQSASSTNSRVLIWCI